MSLSTREYVVSRCRFTDDTQKTDLLSPDITKTELIALLVDVLASISGGAYFIGVTAVKTDHHDDSALGEYTHFNGYCIDCWPFDMTTNDYVPVDSDDMKNFLEAAAKSKWLFQIGLAGAAYNPQCLVWAGSTAFHDDGADHIHFGAQ